MNNRSTRSTTLAALSLGLMALTAAPAATAGPTFVVNTTRDGSQISPDIANLGAAGFVVVWQGPDSSGNGIFARRFAADGSPIGDEFRVHPDANGAQYWPRVAADAFGRYVISYTASTDGIAQQWVRRFNAGGPIDAQPIRLPISFTGPTLAMAPDGTAAFIGYGASTPNEDGEPIRARLFSFDATRPRSAESTVAIGADFGDRSTDACFHADGSLAMVYLSPLQPDFAYRATLLRFNAAGEPIGSTAFLTGGDAEAAELSLACLTDGSYAVAYSDLAESIVGLASVYVQRLSRAGEVLGEPQLLSDTTTPRGANGSGPDIASRPGGGYDVVWGRYRVLSGDSENPDEFEFQIHGQRFSNDGTPVTGRQRIDQAPFPLARARFPAVASGSIASFGVWRSSVGPAQSPTDISGRVLP